MIRHCHGGRRGLLWRLAGLGLLVQFVVVCWIKVQTNVAEEIWWMSHIALLMGGIGLVFETRTLIVTALICVMLPHSMWMFDLVCGSLTGVFPLRMTEYVVDADRSTWIATAHHFFLAPLLFVRILREPRVPSVAWLLPTTVFLYLTIAGRGLCSPELNVNYAWSLFPGVDQSWLHAVNSLPGPIYILLLNAGMAGVVFLPTCWLLRRIRVGQRPTIRFDRLASAATR